MAGRAFWDKLTSLNNCGMSNISDMHLDSTYIKQMVKRRRNCYSSSIVKERVTTKVEDKSYHLWNKNKAQAILLFWRCGALKFKLYNIKRGVGIGCVMPMCGEDQWDHMTKCPFYDTKWNEKWEREEDVANYIVAASRERMIMVKILLI